MTGCSRSSPGNRLPRRHKLPTSRRLSIPGRRQKAARFAHGEDRSHGFGPASWKPLHHWWIKKQYGFCVRVELTTKAVIAKRTRVGPRTNSRVGPRSNFERRSCGVRASLHLLPCRSRRDWCHCGLFSYGHHGSHAQQVATSTSCLDSIPGGLATERPQKCAVCH